MGLTDTPHLWRSPVSERGVSFAERHQVGDLLGERALGYVSKRFRFKSRDMEAVQTNKMFPLIPAQGQDECAVLEGLLIPEVKSVIR